MVLIVFSLLVNCLKCHHKLCYCLDDFKPASVDTSQEAKLEVGKGHHVTLSVPHVEVCNTHIKFKDLLSNKAHQPNIHIYLYITNIRLV